MIGVFANARRRTQPLIYGGRSRLGRAGCASHRRQTTTRRNWESGVWNAAATVLLNEVDAGSLHAPDASAPGAGPRSSGPHCWVAKKRRDVVRFPVSSTASTQSRPRAPRGDGYRPDGTSRAGPARDTSIQLARLIGTDRGLRQGVIASAAAAASRVHLKTNLASEHDSSRRPPEPIGRRALGPHVDMEDVPGQIHEALIEGPAGGLARIFFQAGEGSGALARPDRAAHAARRWCHVSAKIAEYEKTGHRAGLPDVHSIRCRGSVRENARSIRGRWLRMRSTRALIRLRTSHGSRNDSLIRGSRSGFIEIQGRNWRRQGARRDQTSRRARRPEALGNSAAGVDAAFYWDGPKREQDYGRFALSDFTAWRRFLVGHCKHAKPRGCSCLLRVTRRVARVAIVVKQDPSAAVTARTIWEHADSAGTIECSITDGTQLEFARAGRAA